MFQKRIQNSFFSIKNSFKFFLTVKIYDMKTVRKKFKDWKRIFILRFIFKSEKNWEKYIRKRRNLKEMLEFSIFIAMS